MDGSSPKQALKRNLKKGARELFNKAIKRKKAPAKTLKRKRKVKRGPISKTKRLKKQDIFD